MLFVDVEVDEFVCIVTSSFRQCKCFFCKAFHIFRKMFEQTKHRNWLSVKWISRQPNSGIHFLPYFPWWNQTAWIHFPYEKIFLEIILRNWLFVKPNAALNSNSNSNFISLCLSLFAFSVDLTIIMVLKPTTQIWELWRGLKVQPKALK